MTGQGEFMILVTGATGRIGRRVVERLVAARRPVRVLVRNRDKADKLLPSGIEIIEGDLAEYHQVESAVDGAESVLLLSPVAPEQVAIQGNVVKAALATSQPHIVKISGLGTTLDSYIDSGRWHAETEQQITSSGLQYTFLRPLFFFQNLSFLFKSARSTGLIRAGVGDARIAMVDVEDIAEVATILLMKRESLMHQAVTLTSLECVTYQDVANAFTGVLGREVRYEEQSLDEVRHALESTNQPQWHIDILLQFNRAFHEGLGDAANTVAAELLGRPPTTLLQYLEREIENTKGDDGSNPFPS